MNTKMECSVTDGFDEEDYWVAVAKEDEDTAFERLRQQEIDDKIAPMSDLTGWASSYYELPPDATGLQDLIEHKNMNFAVANIFKASYRLGDKPGTTELYDLDKIIWFATREKARLLRLQEEARLEEIQSDDFGSTGKHL